VILKQTIPRETAMFHALKPLPYAYDALEPHYDETTLRLHHDKHHQAYVDKLNEALDDHPDVADMDLEWLLKHPDEIPAPSRRKILNNAGGVWNHDFFWSVMGPAGKAGGGKPSGRIAKAIDAAFGDFASFQAKWKESALGVFGSGWTYLVDQDGKAVIREFANQDTPVGVGVTALLAIDLWEHAYYLKFRNRRTDWIDAWWNVVDWKAVEGRWAAG
jgi:Fe-Mn family superoxide dismutase